MKKMKRYEDGGDVDYDKDSDSEAQKVYRADLTEISDAERMPKRSAPAKKAAKKDDGSYDRKEQRRAMFSGFGKKSAPPKSKFSEMVSKGRIPSGMDLIGMKKGGSVGSASRRADGIAQRGKTRGKLV